MAFTVIDKNTGHYPDCWEIALKEEWAKDLCYCDIEGFAIEEDGTLILLDECGKVAYCPEGRFRIIPEPQWVPVTERLPEPGWYLVRCNEMCKHIHRIAYYYDSVWYEDGNDITKFVTHWVLLLVPPKEGE